MTESGYMVIEFRCGGCGLATLKLTVNEISDMERLLSRVLEDRIEEIVKP